MDRQLLLTSAKWLEDLAVDGEYDSCAACGYGQRLGFGKYQKEHDADCEIMNAAKELRRLADSAEGDR